MSESIISSVFSFFKEISLLVSDEFGCMHQSLYQNKYGYPMLSFKKYVPKVLYQNFIYDLYLYFHAVI